MLKKGVLFLMVLVSAGFVFSANRNQDRKKNAKGKILPAPQVVRSKKAAILPKFNSSILLKEDFETGGAFWTSNGCWAIGSPSNGPNSGHNSNNCAATSLNGDYDNNADDWLTSSMITLPEISGPDSYIRLYFWEWFAMESGYDYGKVMVSTDGGSHWIGLDSRDGSSDWQETMIDLTTFAGKTIKIAFHFISDNTNQYEGWYIDDLQIDLEQPEPLSATMVSLNHQNFPFIYMNVAVDTFGVGFPNLTKANFQVYENNVLQTDYLNVIPPETGGGSRLTDIVFLMDNSGSMAEEQNAVRNNVIDFVNNLRLAGVDFALGLCRYGQDADNGNPYMEDDGQLTKDIGYFQNTLWARNVVDGGTEPGYYAITQAANIFSFRPGAQKVFIIITDETPDQGGATLDNTVSACANNSITLFALTEPDLYNTFEPITSATNGEYFDIYSNFDDILDYISSQVANTFLIRYSSSDPVKNGIERNVNVIVNYNGNQGIAMGSYIPGSTPIITRTQNTLNLHNRAWAQGTRFSIETEITDDIAPFVQSATLYFKNTSTASYQSVSMTNTGGIIWEGIIDGAFVKTPGVDYYISASDGQNSVSSPSVDPINNPYQIAILPNVAPQITHTPVTTLSPNTAITISANIVDNTNSLEGVKLYYRKTGQLIYQNVDMINRSADNYEAEIPASFVTNDGVDYYIKAWDDFGVSGYSGTADNPYQIEAPEDLSIYLDQKLNIINSINDVERPAKLKDDPLFRDIENEAFNYTTNIKDKWLNGTADSKEIEAVARLAISEHLTLKAIQDIIRISSYGAKGLRSVGTSLLLKGIFKGLGKICKNIPLIGNSINKTLTKISEKFEKGSQKLFHIYLTGQVPVQGVPYQTTIPEFIVSKNAANAAFGATSEKIAKAGINAISNKTIGLSLFEKVDDYVQDYLFIDAFEAVAENKQDEAVKMAQRGKLEQEFTACQQDVTQTFNDMVHWNSYVNTSEHFVNTLREIAGWVSFAAGIILIIAGIIAAIPTGGTSLLASIAGLATSIITYSTLISSTLAITEASTVGVYVDAIAPNVFLNKTVDQSFGISSSKLLATNKANVQMDFTQLDTIGIDNELEKEYKFIEKIQAQVLNNNYSLLQNPEIANSLEEKTTNYENKILALYTSVLDTALSIDSNYYNRLSQISTLMASRIIASSVMDIYSLVLNNGLQVDAVKSDVNLFLNTYKTNLINEMTVASQIKQFIENNKLPISPIIGVNDVKCYKDQSSSKIVIKAEVQNYSNSGPLSDIDVILKSNSIVQGDSVVVLTLSSQQTKNMQFEVLQNNNDYISGIIYTSDHNSQEIYKHMGGYPFSFDLEFVVPVTGESLKNENIYFYPNPLNPDKEIGTIRYSLSKSGNVSIKIYDAVNALVRTIIEDAPRDAGVELAEQWNGRNEDGNIVANGVYFYVIESSTGERAVGKIAVLR